MQAQPWKILDSKEVFNHPRIRLVEDTVELPDGKIAMYIKRAPADVYSVAVIAINDKAEVLLQKEYSHPPAKVMWQLPGGQATKGEDVITAANRELSEESGFVGKSCEEIGSYYQDNRRSDLIQHVVLCTDLVAQPGQRDEEEFIETHWIPVAELPAMITSGEFTNVGLLAALNIYFVRTAQQRRA